MALSIQAVSPKRPVLAPVPVQRNATQDNKPMVAKPGAAVAGNKAASTSGSLGTASGSCSSTTCTISSAGAKAAAAASANAAATTSGTGKAAATSRPASTAALVIPTAPAAPASPTGGGFTAGDGDVIVDIQHSDSGYENKIYWSTDNFATKHYLGVDDQVGQVNIGHFAKGTNIQFGIDNGNGNFFRTGGGDANADGQVHARSTQGSDGSTQIGFEDLWGGGDRDFNDAVIGVRNQPSAMPQQTVDSARIENASLAKAVGGTAGAAAAAATKSVATSNAPPKADVTIKKDASKDNRSGLGDGTNPGQGSGRVNSPNTGTLNPGGSTTKTSAKPAATVQQQLQAYLVNQQAAATKDAAAKVAPKVTPKAAGMH